MMTNSVELNKEPWSFYTHFAGFLAAVVGLVALMAMTWGNLPKLAAMSIYGGSLAVLFLASSCYHFFDLGEKGNQWLRRLDHAAIFVLIAGTYVPSLTHLLGGAWRVVMLSLVLGLAAIGILFKLVFYNAHAARKAGTLMYVALGWVIVIPGWKMLPLMTDWALAWLIGGGLVYTFGALIYAKKWPDPLPGTFGSHEVWHLFVLAGAAMHYAFVYCLVDVQMPA